MSIPSELVHLAMPIHLLAGLRLLYLSRDAGPAHSPWYNGSLMSDTKTVLTWTIQATAYVDTTLQYRQRVKIVFILLVYILIYLLT